MEHQDQMYFLRVVTKEHNLDQKKELHEIAEEEDETQNEEDDIVLEIGNLSVSQFFPLQKKIHLYFGFALDFSHSSEKEYEIIQPNDNIKYKKSLSKQLIANIIAVMDHSIQQDKKITEEDRIKMFGIMGEIFSSKDFKPFSQYEIESNNNIRELFLQKLLSDTYKSENQNLKAIILDYFMQACRVVRIHPDSPPIFSVEKHGKDWKIKTYHPTPLEQSMFVGLPVMVMSQCNLEYEVTVMHVKNIHSTFTKTESDEEV